MSFLFLIFSLTFVPHYPAPSCLGCSNSTTNSTKTPFNSGPCWLGQACQWIMRSSGSGGGSSPRHTTPPPPTHVRLLLIPTSEPMVHGVREILKNTEILEQKERTHAKGQRENVQEILQNHTNIDNPRDRIREILSDGGSAAIVPRPSAPRVFGVHGPLKTIGEEWDGVSGRKTSRFRFLP
jgi:hypothetical protein